MKYMYVGFDRKDEVDLYDSNYCEVDTSRMDKAERVLKFELTPSPILDTFIDFYRSYIHTPTPGAKKEYRYNYYIKQTRADYFAAVQGINEVIDRINKFGAIVIPESLKITLAGSIEDTSKKLLDLTRDEMPKLNDLHYIFESKRREIDKLAKDLWIMNNYIHCLEHTEETAGVRSWHMVGAINKIIGVELKPSDYAYFELPEHGSLYLDYATTGKNLMDCFYTDDVELVRSGNVKQQTLITSNFMIEMASGRNRAFDSKRYQEWLIERNIGSYIDLSNPIYTMGRFKLGRLVSPVISESEWFTHFWDNTYSFAGVSFANE